MLALTVVALGTWVCRLRVAARDDVGAVLALAATSLVVSPISWTHTLGLGRLGILYAVGHRRFVAAWVLGSSSSSPRCGSFQPVDSSSWGTPGGRSR